MIGDVHGIWNAKRSGNVSTEVLVLHSDLVSLRVHNEQVNLTSVQALQIADFLRNAAREIENRAKDKVKDKVREVLNERK